MIENEDYEIDLLDILKRLIKKWKLVLLSCVVVAMIAGAAGVYKEHKDRVETNKFIEDYNFNYSYCTYSVANKAKELVSTENPYDTSSIRNVINAVDLYDSYQNEIEYIYDSIDKSMLLKLSTEDIPTSEIRYYIEVNDEVIGAMLDNNTEYVISDSSTYDIINLYINNLKSDDYLQRIIDDLELDTDVKGLSEVVNAYMDSEMLVINAMGRSREESTSIIAEYEKFVDELTPTIKEVFDFNISMASRTFFNSEGKIVLSAKNSKNDEITDITNKVNAIEKTLTSNELEVYEEILRVNYVADKCSEEEFKELYEPEESLINIKWIAIGFIAGGILFCGTFFVAYLFDNKLHTSDELADRFELDNLYDLDNVRSVIAKNNYSKIIVLGDAKSELAIDSCELDVAEYALLAEKLDISDINNVKHDICLCKQHNIVIIGYIVL